MSAEVLAIIAILLLGAAAWWHYRGKAQVPRTLSEDDDPTTPHDHARAHEIAKAQADLQRWSGPQ